MSTLSNRKAFGQNLRTHATHHGHLRKYGQKEIWCFCIFSVQYPTREKPASVSKQVTPYPWELVALKVVFTRLVLG